jgi:protein SCO1/2
MKTPSNTSEKSWTPVAPVAALCVAAATLLSPGPAAAAGPESRWGASYFPNVVLTTQDGKKVRVWDDLLKDKKVLINFIYTECGASCPLETAKLSQVQRILGDRMGKDIFFYSISLDPKRDTPSALKAYAEKFKAGPGWLFLTGKKSDIELVRKKLGQAAGPGENELTDHATTLMIGNASTGQWMRDSATDDPRYIAVMVGDWLSSWKDRKQGESYSKAPPSDGATSDRGAYLFKTRCSACHTVGHGDLLGPDLLGVAFVRDRAWIARYVAVPDEVLASGDPIATALFDKYKRIRMPNLRLGEEDVEALVKFLEAKGAASHGGALRLPVGAGAFASIRDIRIGLPLEGTRALEGTGSTTGAE